MKKRRYLTWLALYLQDRISRLLKETTSTTGLLAYLKHLYSITRHVRLAQKSFRTLPGTGKTNQE